MQPEPIADARRRASRSAAVEQALEEIAHTPLAEACLHGLCDICVADQTSLCHTVRPWEKSPSAGLAGPRPRNP